MATTVKAGGPVEGVVVSFRPASTWTDPGAEDLVSISTGADYEVSECANSDVPAGVVRAVAPDKKVVSVELFCAGAIARLPYTGIPARGNQIQASAATTVKGVASGGLGKVIGVDVVSNYVDVLF